MTLSAGASAGRLFPDASALVARRGASYVLVNELGRQTAIEGPLCREIEQSLEGRAATPALARLAAAHDALGELVRWLATPSVPLTRLDVVRLDGFDTLFIELLGRCNERCVHCYADASPLVDDALERETVMSVIDEAHHLGFRRIQLTGGDPLLCEFLPDAVAHAASTGLAQIEIYTNGLALTDELLDRLAPHRPSFAFSIYSIDPDEHDRITRTPGSHRRTLAAIDRVVARGLPLRAAIIVVEQTSDPQQLVDLLRARGVSTISWTRTFSVGRGVEVSAASQTIAVDVDVASGGAHTSATASTAHEVQRHGKLCVTYRGDVVPCIFQRSAVLGNVRTARLRDLLAVTHEARSARGLPLAGEAATRLQCSSCRLTELGLAFVQRSA